MRRTFEKAIARAQRKAQATAVVLDAAVLFEAHWNDLCDLVAFVEAPRDQRINRLTSARGWTAETLVAREQAQMPLEEKAQQSDFVLHNDAGPEQLTQQVDRLWQRLTTPPGRSGRGTV